MTQPTHDRKIRYAVIGCGQISLQSFIPGLERAANSTLAALVTGDMHKGQALETRYGVRVWHYDDLPDLLASGEVDAVYLATPNALHRRYAVPVLEAGLHLLLEKPMATSVEDCEAILQARRRGGGRLMIAYRLHCEPGTVELVSRCRNGDFGAPVGFSSVFGQDVPQSNHRAHGGYWSGPVPDLGNYPINAVRHMFGAEPVEVTATGTRTPGRTFNFDDTVSVVLRFADGRIADFMVSYACAPVEGLTLFGSRGSVRAMPCYTFGPSVAITYTTLIDGKEDRRSHGPVEQFGGEAFYFSECILNNRDPEPDGEDGLRDVRVLVAVEAALRTGKPQSLPPLAGREGIREDQVVILPPLAEACESDLTGVMPQAVS
ncbi:Gfo/Idh/MocA family protein [Komagataeibacter oboediens]|uniref:Gfo/Idh/MocA family oxidoreductase n=1 Tax=Komagataeibacter oboediens TaxID=65958 RepID=A0A318QQB6_9PROT|nr:Gfo/Idh/MocA family oxidoreductase [Komagataeibacter oboediens]GBR33505.1 putative dehydrogenase [Komagataeibacter oboediens DSM 11826]MBL7232618.1 Gfo/Idh/MocA family oxidoreductase [Komagataeibacter oboediens]MBT0675275.1 Gfo/Idh/MocA family oxidoreductase [Komagataeibacter oboediens]MBT0678886.1 Gfo/Idh/MocA family oxidoreductase [Komagataeibacter oboediens]MBV1823033.1 Gfo/Idh/MocA family oxidoreductase [Komagataeibacter oboediens]